MLHAPRMVAAHTVFTMLFVLIILYTVKDEKMMRLLAITAPLIMWIVTSLITWVAMVVKVDSVRDIIVG